MPMNVLVLTHDPAVDAIVGRALQELGIAVSNFNNVDAAFDALAARKFDAVVMDLDDIIGARDALLGLRKLPSNRRTVVFAVIHDFTTVQQAFELGANFVLDKPLVRERVERSLRAAHGLMQNERRRYFRLPMGSSVSLRLADSDTERLGTLVNLSEGGIAVQVKQKLAIEAPVRFTFHLPDSHKVIEGKGDVAWVDSRGLAGISFRALSVTMKTELQRFLASKFESNLELPMVFVNATSKPHYQ